METAGFNCFALVAFTWLTLRVRMIEAVFFVREVCKPLPNCTASHPHRIENVESDFRSDLDFRSSSPCFHLEEEINPPDTGKNEYLNEDSNWQNQCAGPSAKCRDRRMRHVQESREIFLSPIYIIPVEKSKQALQGNPPGRELHVLNLLIRLLRTSSHRRSLR